MDQLLRSYHSINTINKYQQKPLPERACENKMVDLVRCALLRVVLGADLIFNRRRRSSGPAQ